MLIFSEFLWEKNCREINEDSLAINQVVIGRKPMTMAILCDGIGSLPGGEEASSYVVACMRELFDRIVETRGARLNAMRNATAKQLKIIGNAVSRQLYECNDTLKGKGFGTTVCMIIIYNGEGIVFSAGDSRIYMGRKGHGFRQITPDQQDKSGRLTNAIGVGKKCRLYRKSIKVRQGDAFLLCSDGLYRRNDRLICNCRDYNRYNETRWRDKLKEWYEHAVKCGEKDNAGAVVVWTRKENRYGRGDDYIKE